MSTNKPMFGAVVLEIACGALITTHLSVQKINEGSTVDVGIR